MKKLNNLAYLTLDLELNYHYLLLSIKFHDLCASMVYYYLHDFL